MRRAERPVLLLGVLQNQYFDAVFEPREAFADAKRLRLAALRAFLESFDWPAAAIRI
jgi:hypothetical protein